MTFLPTDIAGCQSWVNDGNYFSDASLSTPITSGTLRGWKDNGANGGNFTLTGVGTATGPTVVQSARNGRSVVRFNGTSNALLNSTLGPLFQGTAPFTIFIAGSQTAANGNKIMSWNTHNQNGDYGYINWRNTNATPNGQSCSRTNAGPERTSPFLCGANFIQSCIKFDGTNVTVTTLGGSSGSGSSASNGATIDQVVLGAIVRPANPNGVLFFGGDIGEVIVYDTALGNTDTQSVINYLDTQWDLSFTIPPVVTPVAYHLGVNLTWPDLGNITNYQVQSSLNGSTGWGTISSPYVPRLFDGSAAMKTYYRVAGLNGATVGPYSAVVNATPGGANTIANTAPALFIGDYPGMGLANNANVNTYTDTSAAGNNLDGTGHPPVNKVNIQNGLAMGLCKIADVDYWTGDAIGAALAGTNVPRCVFIVAKQVTIVIQQCAWILYDSGNGGLSTHDYLVHPDVTAWQLNSRDQADLSELILNVGTLDTNCHIHCCDSDGVNFTLYIDGIPYATGAASNPNLQQFNEFTVGAHRKATNIDQPLDGYVGDVVVLQGGIGPSNVRNVFGILQAKWGTPATPGNATGGRMVCTYIPMNR